MCVIIPSSFGGKVGGGGGGGGIGWARVVRRERQHLIKLRLHKL